MLKQVSTTYKYNTRLARVFSFYVDQLPFHHVTKTEIDTREKEKPNPNVKSLPFPETFECKNVSSCFVKNPFGLRPIPSS